MILAVWPFLVTVLLATRLTPPRDSAERTKARPWRAGIPGELWIGFGIILVGMLWGESIRAEVAPRSEHWLAGGVVGLALFNQMLRSVKGTEHGADRSDLGSPLMWLSLGLVPTAFLTGEYALLDERGRWVAWMVALFLIAIGWIRWRDERRERADEPSSPPREHAGEPA